MATKPGGCLFKIAYWFYTRTRFGYLQHRRELSKARSKYQTGHSVTVPVKFNGLQIIPIAILDDNYSYLIVDTHSNIAVCVDPADPQATMAAIETYNAHPVAILTTHKHWDHCGGNQDMSRAFPDIRIYGGGLDKAAAVTHPVADGDVLEFGPMKFNVKLTPGHTVGHVVYLLDGAPFGAPDSLFSGDHLFLGGCGRMFECPATAMLRSLESIAELKDDTLVWPGHEYASDNLEFAEHLESTNRAVQSKLAWVKSKRKEKECTCPSTLGEEKTYNPFLRLSERSLVQSLGTEIGGQASAANAAASPEAGRARILAEVRERKDAFKYKL